MIGVTPAEYAEGVRVMIEDARARGGGRLGCCHRGRCALHLAENGADYSTLTARHGLACVPNHGGQELAAAFGRASVEEQVRRIVAGVA